MASSEKHEPARKYALAHCPPDPVPVDRCLIQSGRWLFHVMGLSDSNPGSGVPWEKVVAAVAGAAGGAAWVSAVGSGVVALRLRQADLPIEPVVALMSAEHRFAIGAGILILPLPAAFFGFLIDWLVVRPKEHRQVDESGPTDRQEDKSQEDEGQEDKGQEDEGQEEASQEEGKRRHRQRLL
jgi:hypothetical protein